MKDFSVKSTKLKPQKMMIDGKVCISAKRLDNWAYKSCEAECGVGEDWATLNYIRSKEEGKGHATMLLIFIKEFYKRQGLKFGGSVALNDRMHNLYLRLGIKEYC
jgi:GNAT superfamily N-acetyltransferase